MKISTEIASAARIVGEEKAVELIAKAGFDAWDFSMFSMWRYNWASQTVADSDHPLAGNDYLTFARRLKQIGLDNGIRCNQSHAPFPTMGEVAYPYLQRAIECTAEAGGEICVIHPNNHLSAQQNAQIYFDLLPFAKQHGVKIATENMWNWDNDKDEALPAACSSAEDFKAHLDAVNDEFFVACVDIGHAEMKGLGTTAVDMIRHLGDKVAALHIHDNDQWHDSHQIPFSMDIAFEPIVRALHEVDYQGYFTLEVDAYLRSMGYTPETVSEGLKNMASVARKLAGWFDAM